MTKSVLTCSVLIVLGSAASALAQQSSRVDVSAGYMALRVEDQMFPAGWYGDLALGINRWISMVSEVSGGYDNVSLPPDEEIELRARLHGFMTGGRIIVWRGRRLSPFGQFLIGGLRISADFRGVDDESAGAGTFFGIQTGAGIDIHVTPRIAIRTVGDYRHMFQLLGTEDQVRLVTGVVVSLGAR